MGYAEKWKDDQWKRFGMEYGDEEYIDRLEDLQDEFPPEAFLLIAAGFKVLPKKHVEILGRHGLQINYDGKVISQLANTTITEIYLTEINDTVGKVVRKLNVSTGNIKEIKAYFYPRVLGKNQFSGRMAWLLFATARMGTLDEEMVALDEAVAAFIMVNNLEKAHA